MSYVITHAVILTEGIPRSPKDVLIALADHAHNDGSEARPSWKTIERLMGISRPSVARGMAWLEEHGYIMPTEYDGGNASGAKHTVVYRICREKLQWVPNLFTDEEIKKGLTMRPLSDEKGTELRPLSDEKTDKGLNSEGKGLTMNEKGITMRPQSVLESVPSESVNKSVLSSSDKPTNVLSSFSEKTEKTPEPERPSNITPLRPSDPLDRQLTLPRDSARGQAWEDWNEVLDALRAEGAPRTDITDILCFANIRHDYGHSVTGRYLLNYWRDQKAKPKFGSTVSNDKGA